MERAEGTRPFGYGECSEAPPSPGHFREPAKTAVDGEAKASQRSVGRLWGPFVHGISRYFRRRRSRLFLEVPQFNALSVCDVGRSLHFWEKVDPHLVPKDLTLLNVKADGQAEGYSGAANQVSIILYDGKKIPFPDDAFDAVVCNSVIEHIPPHERDAFVSEVLRVAKYVFVQTPAYVFPIEPHFVFPFLHWLPKPFARRMVPFTLWSLLSKPSPQSQQSYFEEVNLLTLAEFRKYFPGAKLAVERLLGIPKSYTLHSQSAPVRARRLRGIRAQS